MRGGSIDKTAAGKWRARLTVSPGNRVAIGIYDTVEEARAELAKAVDAIRSANDIRASIGTVESPPFGGVYYACIRSRFDTAIKIGWSKSIESRMVDLCRFCPWPIDLVGYESHAPMSVERIRHAQFAAWRIPNPKNTEWFFPSTELRAHIKSLQVAIRRAP